MEKNTERKSPRNDVPFYLFSFAPISSEQREMRKGMDLRRDGAPLSHGRAGDSRGTFAGISPSARLTRLPRPDN